MVRIVGILLRGRKDHGHLACKLGSDVFKRPVTHVFIVDRHQHIIFVDLYRVQVGIRSSYDSIRCLSGSKVTTSSRA